MLNPDTFAITLGRAVELFRARPDATDEQKTQLRAIVALTQLGDVRLALQEGRLVVAGTAIAETLPGIPTLVAQMDAHDVAEIRIARRASPADLLQLVRGLSGGLGAFADGRGLGDRLRDSRVTSVAVLTVPPAAPPPNGRRPPTVTEAFDAERLEREQHAVAEATSGPHPTPLTDAIAGLALDPASPDVLDRATAAAELVRGAMVAGRTSGAFHAVAELVRLEDRLPAGSARSSFAIVLNRLLTRPLLQAAVERARDAKDGAAALLVVRRGGADATEVLLERLVQAQSIGERRQMFDLLKQVADGLRQVILMLGHPEWYAVRNVADLLGELRVAEAVGPLARTLRHSDVRARRAAALALARIGTPETMEHIAQALGDPNPELRASIAAAIGGREMEGLALPLVTAAEREKSPQVVHEFYRALGRLGTSVALQALTRGAQPPGWRPWRNRPDRRLAAIEGLKLAGGPAAVAVLETLLEDKDREVRRSAREALEDLDVL